MSPISEFVSTEAVAISSGLEQSYGVPAVSLATLPAIHDGPFSSRWAPRVFDSTGNTPDASPVGRRKVLGGLRDTGAFAFKLYTSANPEMLGFEPLLESCGLIREGPGIRWRPSRHCRSQTLRLYLANLMHEITGAYGAVSFAAAAPGQPVFVTFRLEGRYHDREASSIPRPPMTSAACVKFCGSGLEVDPDNAAPLALRYQAFDVGVATEAIDLRNGRGAGARLKVLSAQETWSVTVEENGYDFQRAFREQVTFALYQNIGGWIFSTPGGRAFTLAAPPVYARGAGGITLANLVFGTRGRRGDHVELRRV